MKDKLDLDLLQEEDDLEDTQEGKYLTFLLINEEYGLEIQYVTEIIGIQRITEVPDVPEYIKGVINLRGKVIPVMDVRLRFGAAVREYDERTCIIVIQVKGQPMGLIVDRVSEVLDIPKQDIEPAPSMRRSRENRYIQGMGKVGEQVKLLLDVEKLLEE
ncbi:chemotaxis protein CheW [Desulfotomaculum sp. 1211_IL3151]|uniref:chemotaxis protein CheW n=1 Tax=Desulfotomaculum sp. 1211_IL3151 TaxID=3084055 RepID=UPI002FDB3016